LEVDSILREQLYSNHSVVLSNRPLSFDPVLNFHKHHVITNGLTLYFIHVFKKELTVYIKSNKLAVYENGYENTRVQQTCVTLLKWIMYVYTTEH